MNVITRLLDGFFAFSTVHWMMAAPGMECASASAAHPEGRGYDREGVHDE